MFNKFKNISNTTLDLYLLKSYRKIGFRFEVLVKNIGNWTLNLHKPS